MRLRAILGSTEPEKIPNRRGPPVLEDERRTVELSETLKDILGVVVVLEDG